MKKNFLNVKSVITAASLMLMMIISSCLSTAQKLQGGYLNNLNSDGVIIDGYDPVAFFTDNKPVKGDTNRIFADEKYLYVAS